MLTSLTGRRWRLPDANEGLALAISQRHGLPEVVGRLLAARGIGIGETPAFLAPRLRDHLVDPSHLEDLDRAAARLAEAVLSGERVGLIGDYDVDGATSLALVGRWLAHFGLTYVWEVPDRLGDGYGASAAAFDRLAAAGCRLCLTLDNGTTAFAALAHAAAQNQEVIVIDHHAAEPALPQALAVVNPNRQDQASPLGHLAAVGVAFVLLVAVNRELKRRRPELALPDMLAWLDLVALGTVADVVALTGLNRAYVHQGLRLAASSPSAGLAALAAAAGLAVIDQPSQLSFALAPRLNAAGRMGEPALAVRLLLTDDPAEAARLATRLNDLNLARRTIERQVQAAAEAQAQRQLDEGRPILVLAGEGWHLGVLGIVAGRLTERHHRPTIVVALGPDGAGRGSGRSGPGFDLGAAVIAARQAGLLNTGGGHQAAAGLGFAAGGLDRLTTFLQERLQTAPPPAGSAPLDLDGRLSVGAIRPELAQELAQVAPFGPGNREPRFCVDGARFAEPRAVGDGHLSGRLVGVAGGWVRAIAFRCADGPLANALAAGGPLRLAARIRAERWNDELRATVEIDDAAA